MLLTQREQVVDRCFAAVTEELDVMHLAVINDRPVSGTFGVRHQTFPSPNVESSGDERLVSDTKRSGAVGV